MNKKYISVFKKQSYSILLIFFSILTFVLIYNSCTDEISYSKVLNSFSQNFDMTINNGDLSTNRPDVSLSLKVPETDIMNQKINFEMKLSEKPDCTDGKWEPYSPSKNWSLSVNLGKKEEQEISIYVQFREQRHPGVSYTYRTEEFAQMKGASKCFRTSIVYDRSPPRNFKLFNPPADPTNQKIAKFNFSGEDHSPIFFECKLVLSTRHLSSKPILPVRNKKTYGKASKKKIRKKASILRKTANTQDDPLEKLKEWHPCGSPTSKDGFKTSGSVSYGDPTSPPFTDPLEDGDYQFFVRAKDSLGNRSENSLNHPWTVDSKVPSIVFLSPLCGGRESSTKRNIFVDTIPIKIDAPSFSHSSRKFSIQCSQNGVDWFPAFGKTRMEPPNKRLEIPKTCFNSTPLTDFSFYSDTIYKKHTVTVKAVDDQGNTGGVSTCTWEIIPQNAELLVDKQAPQSKKKKADILFIIDHSDSMKKKAEVLSSRFDGLIKSLSSELNWQIAVASMEKSKRSPFTDPAPYYFGNFLSIRSSQCPTLPQNPTPSSRKESNYIRHLSNRTSQYILSSSISSCSDPTYCSTSTLNLQNAFMNTMKCPDFKGIEEYGIRAAYKILNQYESAKNKETQGESGTLSNEEKAYLRFFREDATFVTIFLTDEPNCDGLPGKTKNNLTNCTASIKPSECYEFNASSESESAENLTQEVECLFECDKFNASSESDRPDDLIQKVKCLFGDDKKFLAYPIVPTDDSGVGTHFADNEHYVDLAIKTQGINKNSPESLNTLIRVAVCGPSRSHDCPAPTPGSYTTGLQNISDHIVKITSKTIQLTCPRDEVPASNEQLRIPGPIYFFKPRDGTSFTEMTPHQSQTNPPSSHTFVTGGKKHYIKIQESWKTSGENDQQAIRAKLTPVGSSTTSTDPNLPDGTYRVEYLCAPSSG